MVPNLRRWKESRTKGRRGSAWRAATAQLTACSGKAPVCPSTPALASTRFEEMVNITHASTRGSSMEREQSWCKAATPANARPASGNARRRFARPIKTNKQMTNKLRFARRGVPYQETPTTPLSTGGTLTSVAAARTPWCSTASSAWRWRTFSQNICLTPFLLFRWRTWRVVEPSQAGGFVLSAAS